MPPIRIGLIGCGWMNSQHATHLITLPGEVELVGFVNPTLTKAADLAARCGVERPYITSDHHALFREVKPDAVIVSIPPYAHTDQVTAAAERGIHVFNEKPIALTVDKAWEMVEACEKAGVVSQVGFMMRFGAAIERLKALLVSGEAGRPGMVMARYFCNSLHSAWWRAKDKSGGQVFEQAIHLVDVMRHLLGEAETAYSLQRNLFHKDVPDYTVEDTSGSVFSFKGGPVGVLGASNAAVPGRWEYDLRFVARNLTAFVSDANHAEILHTAGPEVASETVTAERSLAAAEMDDFLAAIRAGRQARVPMREGALTLEVVAAAARSAQTGREVMIHPTQ